MRRLSGHPVARGGCSLKHVIAAFNDRHAAENAADKLHQIGFSKDEVSLVAKGEEGEGHGHGDQDGFDASKLTSGTSWGAGIGGAAGLLAAAGIIAIPGIGPILAIGPIAATLTGAATGGVAGALTDWGLPQAVGKKYEADVKAGQAVVAVDCKDDVFAEKARTSLQDAGGHDIEVH